LQVDLSGMPYSSALERVLSALGLE
jgi:hypothetical protein